MKPRTDEERIRQEAEFAALCKRINKAFKQGKRKLVSKLLKQAKR